MRKLLILLFVPIVLFWSCEDGSTELTMCEYTSEFAETYRPIAKMLNAYESNTIDLDPEITSRFLEQLYAISNHEDTDNFIQIIDDSLVRTSLDSFFISFYTDSIETQQLIETGFSTNAAFDSITNLYGISFDEFSQTGSNTISYNISLNNEVSTKVLTSYLSSFSFVSLSSALNTSSYTIQDVPFGFGYYIQAVESSNSTTKIELYIFDGFCFTPPPPPTIIHSYGIDENCVVTKIN